MQVALGLIADAANISREGKLNVLGVWDRIQTASFPAVHPALTLVLRLEASPAERGDTKRITVRLLGEDGENLAELEGTSIIPSDSAELSPTANVLLNLRNMLIPKAGRYTFHVLINGEPKREVSFRAEQLPSDTAGE